MNPLSSNSTGKEQPISITPKNKLQSHETKTDTVSKKTIQVQKNSSSNKEFIATHEEKSPKLERVAKLLQQYREASDGPDISDGIDEISQTLDKFALPLDENSIFSGTDLIVIHDSFEGTLPINGIKKNELERTEQLFKNIAEGKDKIFISEDSFKTDAESLIKMLLTRNIGRKLIQKVLDNPFITKIEILAGERSQLQKTDIEGEFKLILNQFDKAGGPALTPNGKLKIQTTPLHISLGHELVHASHLPNTLENSLPTFSHKYHDLEEQLTITGLKKDLSLEDPDSTIDNYDELNEWNITAAFTNNHDVYYPRFSHEGISLNNALPLRADDIENYSELEIKRLRDDITSLVKIGALYDLEQMDADIHKLFENEPLPLIFSSLLSGNMNTVHFLLNKGFDITIQSDSNENAAEYLFKSISTTHIQEYSEIIDFLNKNKIFPHIPTLLLNYDEKLKNTLKLAFEEELLSPNFTIPFGLVVKFGKPSNNVQNREIVKILLEAASENIKSFLNESHTASEYAKKGEHFYQIAGKLQDNGYDATQLKNSINELYRRKKEL